LNTKPSSVIKLLALTMVLFFTVGVLSVWLSAQIRGISVQESDKEYVTDLDSAEVDENWEAVKLSLEAIISFPQWLHDEDEPSLTEWLSVEQIRWLPQAKEDIIYTVDTQLDSFLNVTMEVIYHDHSYWEMKGTLAEGNEISIKAEDEEAVLRWQEKEIRVPGIHLSLLFPYVHFEAIQAHDVVYKAWEEHNSGYHVFIEADEDLVSTLFREILSNNSEATNNILSIEGYTISYDLYFKRTDNDGIQLKKLMYQLYFQEEPLENILFQFQ